MNKTRRSTAASRSETLSPKEYNDILASLVLKSARLSSAQITAVALHGKDRLAVDMSLTADWQQAAKDEVLIIAHCRFAARVKTSDKEAVTISADYEILLGTVRDFTDEFFAIYRDLSLPVNVWPYFREFVQNMLGRAGYPPFTLPLLIRPATSSPRRGRRTKTQ